MKKRPITLDELARLRAEDPLPPMMGKTRVGLDPIREAREAARRAKGPRMTQGHGTRRSKRPGGGDS